MSLAHFGANVSLGDAWKITHCLKTVLGIFGGMESFFRDGARATFGDKLLKGLHFVVVAGLHVEKTRLAYSIFQVARMAQHKRLPEVFGLFQLMFKRCMPILPPRDLQGFYRQLP